MTGWNIHLLYQMDSATASHFFNTANSYGTGPDTGGVPVIDGFDAASVLAYTSYAQFSSDIANHEIPASVTWVLYDPEMWSQTPANEQQNPALYLRLFGQLAHANGLKVIEVPGRDLGLVTGSACPKNAGESLDHWYLRCNIAGAAAANADILVVQDQMNVGNVTEFGNLYNTAHFQARAANSQVVVYAEVSTNYGTPDQMAAAARSVNADGYYISSTGSGLGGTDRFLHQMQAAGY